MIVNVLKKHAQGKPDSKYGSLGTLCGKNRGHALVAKPHEEVNCGNCLRKLQRLAYMKKINSDG